MAMKQFIRVLLLSAISLCAATVQAQRVIDKEKEAEGVKEQEPARDKNFKSKIWYGGGLLLGFSGYQGNSVFSFGLSPMVGYKIIQQVSIGPRVEFTYSSVKQPGFKAVSLFDVDAGVFLRFSPFRGLFLQGELSNEWYQDAVLFSTEKIKGSRFNQRVGIGWNFGQGGGGGASEIGVFYNFAIANELNTYENPLGYRFGFTWNF